MKLVQKLVILFGLVAIGGAALAQNRTSFAGVKNTADYAYGWQAGISGLQIGNMTSVSTAGQSATYTVTVGNVVAGDGTTFAPLSTVAPVTIVNGSGVDTATPSAVSCSTPAIIYSCSFTATFTYSHGNGDIVRSGTYGLQETLNLISSQGGGRAAIDWRWTQSGGTNTLITAATVMPYAVIEDNRTFTPTFWYPQAGATTILALPTTLTAVTALPSATPVGGYGTGTYHLCIAYVDLMGQEGPCSADFSEAGLATGSFIFSAPAASTGAVGYTIYISLTGGTYTLAYKVPLTSTICTLTALETTTPACAVANTTYGQSGATATVTAITVNTSPILLNKTVISTTAITHGTPNGRTTYVYAPGSGLALSGITGATFPFTIGAAAGSTVPSALGTINIPPGYMNAVGKKIRVCGYGTTASTSAATVLEMSLQWDSFGQNTAGLPVTVADNQATAISAFSGTLVNVSFCDTLVTTVAGAGATAGSLMQVGGYACWGVTSAGVQPTCSPTSTTAAVGSLNLASEARLHVVYTHVTGTDGAGFTLNGVTVEGL